MDLQSHLITLSNTPGISGYEGPVREQIVNAWQDLAASPVVDGLGTVLVTLRGNGPDPRPKVLVTAHMDEIGLIVTDVKDGFLRVNSVGGIDRRVLPGQPVIVHGEQALPGLIGSRPPHILSSAERGKYPDYNDLVVDTGLPQRQLEKLVPIGAPVTFDQEAVEVNSGMITGKAMDNRVSCACLTLILDELRNRQHYWDVQVAATVQEEVTLGGAQTIAWRTQPDIAIVIDTTWAIGTGVSDDKGFKLGDGPSIIIGPNAHPKLFNLVTEEAKAAEIKLHPEPMTRGSGTEAWAVQVSRDGIPCAILSIPIRNMHTPVEVVALKDIERTARLVVEVITALDGESLAKLAMDEED
jgi:endoglucanase